MLITNNAYSDVVIVILLMLLITNNNTFEMIMEFSNDNGYTMIFNAITHIP